ncbi:MAG: sulfotransferase family protein, partial [Alphaproteobacteria bacterium]|nr:sulfotransferase family protein [Alphaproteobacteria bacterium]
CSRTTPQHMERASHSILIPEGFADHSFAILRDPMDRLLSEYRYRALRRNRPRDLPTYIGPHDELTVELDWETEFHGSFDQWVATIFAGHSSDPYLCDNHVRPQADFICEHAQLFMFKDGLGDVFDWIDKVTGTQRQVIGLDHNASPQFAIDMQDETRQKIMNFYSADYRAIDSLTAARTHSPA